MKKIFTIFSIATCACAALAQEQEITQQLILGSQGDAGTWGYGFAETVPSDASLIATADWGKLNIAKGYSSVTTVVVDIESISGEWKVVCDETGQYSDPLQGGVNTITFDSEAKQAVLMSTSKDNTLKLKSVKINGVQTAYQTMYNIGFYNLALLDNNQSYASKYFVGTNASGKAAASLNLVLDREVEEGVFKLTVTYTDGTGERYWDITGTGGKFDIGANVKEARIMVDNMKGKSIYVKSATLSYKFTALRPTTSSAEVVSTTYYNLAGAKLSEPQRGLNVVVRALSDGSTVTEKVVVE
ncbi:MAG: hypothetical protein II375_03350 [Bacteroidales bacterium]|nr:hypothetical protein [Bacteroidales bacterium]